MHRSTRTTIPKSVPGRSARLAAIDLGSNSIRLVIADVSLSGGYRVIDDEKVITRLGRSSAESGKLDPMAMDETIEAVAHMVDVARGFGVDRLRIVATAAVREADNRTDFIDRLESRIACPVEVASAETEAALAFRSVCVEVDLAKTTSAIVDVGGGSTELIFADHDQMIGFAPIPIGAVRMTERFGSCTDASGEQLRALREFTDQTVRSSVKAPISQIEIMIGTGGAITTLAAMSMYRAQGDQRAQLPPAATRGHTITLDEVRWFADTIGRMPIEDRKAVRGLSPDRADIIVAGLVIVESIMQHLGIDKLRVHDRGIRDGIILDMMDQLKAMPGTKGFELSTPINAAIELADRCGVRRSDAVHVAALATSIFDQCVDLNLFEENDEDRTLLEAAAILRDVGQIMSHTRHHRHSYHLISNSGLAGFTHEQINLVAVIARYHRKAAPSEAHNEFNQLAPNDQRRVRRLSAILRIADGLDRTHAHLIRSVHLVRDEGEILRFEVQARSDPRACITVAQRNAQLFAQTFDVKPEIVWRRDQIQEPSGRDRRAKGFRPYLNEQFPGKLVVVEGLDGSGKSTQLDLLKKWAASQGYSSYFTEWNSSDLVRQTTIRGKARKLLSPLTFSLVHAADFADRLEGEILPSLRAGGLVFADRYVYTAFARDAARGMDREFIRRLYRFAPKPTVAVYFRLSLDEALSRILLGRPELKYYEAGMDMGFSEDPYKSFKIFQGRIYDEYEAMVSERNLTVIDATLPISDQQAKFRDLVKPHLEHVIRVPIVNRSDILNRHELVGRYLS